MLIRPFSAVPDLRFDVDSWTVALSVLHRTVALQQEPPSVAERVVMFGSRSYSTLRWIRVVA